MSQTTATPATSSSQNSEKVSKTEQALRRGYVPPVAKKSLVKFWESEIAQYYGWNAENTVIIDDSVEKVADTISNALVIPSCDYTDVDYRADCDDVLLRVLAYLRVFMEGPECGDVREYLRLYPFSEAMERRRFIFE